MNHEYPYRYMIDDGVLLVLGSDFPADSRINPFIHIEGSVTRHYYELPLSSKIKNPTNRLSVKEAVESYTINGAKLLRMENHIGSLEVGKLADLIVVDQNIMEIDPNQIHQTRVLMTMMDGKVWHDVVFGSAGVTRKTTKCRIRREFCPAMRPTSINVIRPYAREACRNV